MTWNSVWPLGTVSVRANRTTGQQNTTYIETNMGNTIVGSNTVTTRDHFWDVDANLDGRHRFIQSPKFTSTAVAPNDVNPVIGTGMDAVLYVKETNSDKDVQGFYHNAVNIYQYIPSFRLGTHDITSNYTNMLAIPDNSYGEIFIWRTGIDVNSMQYAIFKVEGTVCQTWSVQQSCSNNASTIAAFPLNFANGLNSLGLNIRVKLGAATASGPGVLWNYRVTYRTM